MLMMVMTKNLVHHERDVVVLADLRQPSEERWRPVVVAALGLERLPGYQECLRNSCIRHIRSTQVFTNTYYRRSHFQHTVTHSKTLADNHNTHTPTWIGSEITPATGCPSALDCARISSTRARQRASSASFSRRFSSSGYL